MAEEVQVPNRPVPTPAQPVPIQRGVHRPGSAKRIGRQVTRDDRRKLLNARANAQKMFQEGLASVLDLIAPASLVVTPNFLKLNNKYVRTLFVYTYPRYIQTNWLSEVINYDVEFDVSMFIYPQDSSQIMGNLKRKATQLESTQAVEQEKGLIRDPELETAIGDIEELRDVLQRGESRLFHFALYVSVYAYNEEDLNQVVNHIESGLGGMLIYTKQSLLQMEQGFNSTLPILKDELQVNRNLDTGSLSTAFPFTSASLTSNEGVLYGINRHNSSLILFDRFNLENANSVVFAKAGAGKSYTVKLEALRSLMLGVDIIVIDPENEYERLAEAVGGTYIKLSINSQTRINPFDLPASTGLNVGEDGLRSTVTMLHGLISLMVSGLSPEEDALLDRALYETYGLKDISTDPLTQTNQPPLLTDLHSVLLNMTGAESLANRLSKFTEGSFSGLFTQPTNFDLARGFVAFSVRDLEDELRPIGMYLILNYIWNRVRYDQRKRILIIDEAWFMMQHEDSAKFVYSIAKRARKYFLGLTVITQDVEDFLASQYGRSVITNSSLQMLLKQSPAAVDELSEVFNLTDGEKLWLLEADVGEGLFFAGLNHVAIKVVASYNEDRLITTDPQQLLDMSTEDAESSLQANAEAAQKAFSSPTSSLPGVTVTAGAVNPETATAPVAPVTEVTEPVQDMTTQETQSEPLINEQPVLESAAAPVTPQTVPVLPTPTAQTYLDSAPPMPGAVSNPTPASPPPGYPPPQQ